MVNSLDVKQRGVVGKIFFPDSSEPRPAIITLSGSSGGFYEGPAKLFAQDGYVDIPR